MLRAILAILLWAFLLIVVGIPVLLAGLVYPSRTVGAFGTRVWAKAMLWVCGVRLSVCGADAVTDGTPRFFIGNHQSALDIPIVLAALHGDVRFMAKKSLFFIPIFGWIIARYGYVAIDRSSARVTVADINRALERARRNPVSFAVFPEGTRSRDGRLGSFRMGTVKICQRWGFPVVPFSIRGAIDVAHRDRMFAVRPGSVRLTFGQPIPAEEAAQMSPVELHDRIRAVILSHLNDRGREAELAEPALARSSV